MSEDAYRPPPITPFGGWVPDEKTGRLRPLETAPHIGGFAPPGTGKTRKWLAQSAVLWPGPAFVSSSKDDLMQMVASRRYGPFGAAGFAAGQRPVLSERIPKATGLIRPR